MLPQAARGHEDGSRMAESSLSPQRARRLVLIAICVGMAAYFFAESGNIFDEAEHLHVAWLMTVRHLRPLHDFFEHHTPLLWHVLSVPYRLGMNGPEVLYAGRLFVAVAAAIWVYALFSLARRWSAAPAREQAGVPALILFVLTVLITEEMFVLRPETLGAALFAPALLLWTRPSRSLPTAAAAGALAALACCSSPRFALLLPVFVLAGPEGRPALPWPRIAAATGAGAAALGAFFAFVCPWREFLFDVRFSALLQHVGTIPDIRLSVHTGSAAVVMAIFGFWLALTGARAKAVVPWIALGAVILVSCVAAAGSYPYTQAFFPVFLWATLFAAWLDAQPMTSESAAIRTRTLSVLEGCVLLVVIVQLWAASNSMYGAPALTASRSMLMEQLPPGGRVMLIPGAHPITADDGSYWGAVINDESPGKMCTAVERYRELYPALPFRLPRCDLLSDLNRGPALISRILFLAVDVSQVDAVRETIDARYTECEGLSAAPTRTFYSNILCRKRQER
jgi:hypothetical protein